MCPPRVLHRQLASARDHAHPPLPATLVRMMRSYVHQGADEHGDPCPCVPVPRARTQGSDNEEDEDEEGGGKDDDEERRKEKKRKEAVAQWIQSVAVRVTDGHTHSAAVDHLCWSDVRLARCGPSAVVLCISSVVWWRVGHRRSRAWLQTRMHEHPC